MSKYGLRLKVGVLAAAVLGASSAAAVTVSQTLDVDSSADLVFTFNGLAPSDGNGGTVLIEELGLDSSYPGIDLIGVGGDTFEPVVDGESQGVYSCDGNGGSITVANVISTVTNSDCVFAQPIFIPGGELNTALADGSVVVRLIFGSTFTAFAGDLDQLRVTLSYEEATTVVPLPAGMPLLLGAFGGLALLRRRR